MMSSFRRSSSSGTDVHETIISSLGSSRSGVGLARARSSTRNPSTTSFGFQPSQPVVSAAISTGCPSCAREHAGERVAIGFDLRKHDEADGEQRQRERRETDDDDGPDEADQREGDRAGSAEDGARGRHNGAASAL